MKKNFLIKIQNPGNPPTVSAATILNKAWHFTSYCHTWACSKKTRRNSKNQKTASFSQISFSTCSFSSDFGIKKKHSEYHPWNPSTRICRPSTLIGVNKHCNHRRSRHTCPFAVIAAALLLNAACYCYSLFLKESSHALACRHYLHAFRIFFSIFSPVREVFFFPWKVR